MRLDPDHELSPQAIAALKDLLQEPEPTKDEMLSDERLESFILGTASEASRRATVRALVASRELRLRMVRLQADLRLASSADYGHESPFREVLGHGISHALGLNDSIEAWNADPNWDLFDEQTPAFLRASLEAVGRSLNALLAMPRYATLRGGANSGPIGATLYAEIDDEGTLVVDAVLATSEFGRAYLDLIDPAGGFVRLGRAPVERRKSRFVLKEFATKLGLEEGSLPGSLFRVTTSADELIDSFEGFMPVQDGSLNRIAIVPEPPVWNDGVLSLTLAFSESMREKPELFELFTKVGSVEVVLYRCPLSEFGDGNRPIHIQADGTGGARNVCGSLLQARIVSVARPESF